jgi:hypothetical protein
MVITKVNNKGDLAEATNFSGNEIIGYNNDNKSILIDVNRGYSQTTTADRSNEDDGYARKQLYGKGRTAAANETSYGLGYYYRRNP